MRRTTAAVFGTLAGTALLAGLKFGTGGAGGANAAAGNPAPATQGGDPVPSSAAPNPSAQPSSSAAPDKKSKKKKKKKGTPTPGASETTKKSTPPKPGGGGGMTNGTYTGTRQTNPYGTVTVTITVSGGKITGVSANYPTSPSMSATINSKAIPKLKSEAIAAQNAGISSVSGATYTSTGFKASLASAIAKA